MSEPVAIIQRNKSGLIYLVSPRGGHFDMSKHVGSSLYLGDEIEQGAMTELQTENRALSSRAIDCKMSRTHERAEMAITAIADLAGALERFLVFVWTLDRQSTIDALLGAARYAYEIGRYEDVQQMIFCSNFLLKYSDRDFV